MSTLLITNGRVIDPKSGFDKVADVYVVDGTIKTIGTKLGKKADKTIDASGLVVAPGLIDLHVHVREPGREDKETIETASRAALNGGVTSMVAMPNSAVAADNQTVIEFIIKRAQEHDLVNIYPGGAITRGLRGDLLAEMWELKQSGAVMVTDDGFDIQDEGVLLSAMRYAKTHDILVMSHCETDALDEDGVMHEGWVSTELGLPGIPEVSEDVAVQKAILLSQKAGVRFHGTHLSTSGAVSAFREAKKANPTLTCDVAVQHFALTDDECRGYNTNAKMYPPLRPQQHVDAIIAAIKDGTVDALCTDHAPHIEPEKIVPFVDAQRGTVGLETSFAVMNTYLVDAGHISIAEGLALMTHKPAQIIRINKGTLTEGADADIAIFDMKASWTVDPDQFESKGKNSVFTGKKLKGKAVHVIVGGEIKKLDGNVL